ncbi:MAG: Mu transposase C-terminal domain-containing protein [gamma proteobacterium symbiont of Lucinoma myriamae]|nr:Mu transposase C-terminal domain-containing protein [gamma proteobacterium symbiont of Lucinoma myriamae]MCU7819742.1 Mu transposase C-terminal domain-containing protein [gamma proteobacterium symbiont of Lucinoma myriamae]MCU7832145.1 Mu transposase C-terminal domain-containing protein [gamma proteobacterium symbiont of Lucinoma myriamae]
MFLHNDVYVMGSRRIRILWTYEQIIIWIDIDDIKALPENSSRIEFEHLVANDELKDIDDPYITKVLSSPKVGSKSELIQKKAWNAIKDVVNLQPDIYKRKERGIIVNEAFKCHGITKQTYYRYLRRYWQFGNCQNALSANYDKCGSAGEQRKAGKAKRGRPRTRTPGIGVNVDDNIRKFFRVAIEKSYLKKGKYEFTYAFNQMLIAFGIDPLKKDPIAIAEAPTEMQFNYFFKQEYSPIEVTKRREGDVNYLKDFRPVLGTSTAEVAGPGSRYQIDATIGDVYLVSSIDQSKIIGRPVIYIVVDVFSRLVTGVYVGLESPSWVSAMEALANTVCEKQAFCKAFDIDITPEQWPAVGLPEVIMADKGEMLGRHIEVLSKAFHVSIENAAAYRADWKGIVERYFRTIQVKFKPYVEGYVPGIPIGKKRNGPDYRLDATLTLHEFTQMIIRCILYYNNDHCLTKYDPDADIPATLEHNPRTLWEWGIKYRTGKLRRAPEDLVSINLLPHTQATITEKGISLFKCFYTNAEALGLGWFERNYSGVKKITVAYDPYSANKIYIRPNNKYDEYWIATLTPRSREFADMTIWEVWQRNDIKATTAATSQLKKKAGELELDYHLKNIAETAKSSKPDVSHIPKSQQTKGIRQNRIEEKKHERMKKTQSKSDTVETQPISNVVPINSNNNQEKDYGIPDMIDDLFEDDDEE